MPEHSQTMKTWLIITILDNLTSCETKAWNWTDGIRTHDPCDAGGELYQLSYPFYQANCEHIMLWVRNIPAGDEECKWIHEKSYIWYIKNSQPNVTNRSSRVGL